jgi:tetratricopeptide (TPR) repeat protein
LALTLAQRANLALDEGEFEEALALYREALGLCREFGLRQRTAICLSGVSSALLELGRLDDAVRIGAAADRIAEEMTLWSSLDSDVDPRAFGIHNDLGQARRDELVAEGRSLSEEDAIDLALSV